MRIKIFVLGPLIALLPSLNVSAEMITGHELVKRQQAAPFGAIVEHCRQNSPESVQTVEAGYSSYLKNLDEAMATWVSEKPGMQQHLEQSIPTDSMEYREVEAMLKNASDMILSNIKKLDPQRYCPWVAGRLNASTQESILKSLHEYDARVEASLQKERHEE